MTELEDSRKLALDVPRVGKGDLCLKLLDEADRTTDPKRQEQLEGHFREARCDEAFPAAMSKAAKEFSDEVWSNAATISKLPAEPRSKQ